MGGRRVDHDRAWAQDPAAELPMGTSRSHSREPLSKGLSPFRRARPIGGQPMSRRIRGAVAIGLGWLLWGSEEARGEVVEFRAGGTACLPAEIDGDVVKLLAPGKSYEFRRSDFRAIEPGGCPEREWPEKLKGAKSGGARALYEAGWWALSHGLTTEAVDCLVEAHRIDPSMEPLGKLTRVVERLGGARPDPDVDRVKAGLATSFEETRSDHVLLLHQQPEAEAKELVETLEKVIATFYLTFTAQGFDLELPAERVVVVWYAESDLFHEQVKREAGEYLPSNDGYYAPARGIVLLADTRDTPAHRNAAEANRERMSQVERAAEEVGRMPARGRVRLSLAGEPSRPMDRAGASQSLDRARREVDRQERLLDLRRRQIDVGTAAHEMVHLLASRSGLLPGGASYPIWLQEGLATQFEVVRGGRWAGVGRVHESRLDEWNRTGHRVRLDSLLSDAGLGHGYEPGRYAASWAWVHYLRQKHPGAFVDYLDRLRAPSRQGAAEGTEYLIGRIGSPLEEVEADWHEYMKILKTARSG